ncbi:hypothetical protein K435DRAFT_523737 [Dendrothele bispora CBS 962.96]|uniref:Uncharacterized protein n=1 Tax=Dendrothele bispora (strain CBS 962.96) TaxID=1314807 RepID=A0A4S8KUY0_DENBC|nr:hypothetical protein K435DRAFT_523737 [Dendrothele bispora CBS 962.96]
MTPVTTNSTVIDAIDHATSEDHEPLTSVDVPGPLSGTSKKTTVINRDAGPSDPPASGTSEATVTNEQDAEVLRTVSPSACTNVIVAQSVQMLQGSSHSEFNNGQFNNAGRDNLNTINYHIHGNATIYCSSTDSVDRHISSTGSTKIVLQNNMPSQLEDVSDQYTETGSILASTAEEDGTTTGVQTGITTPHEVQRDASACENQPSRSCPCPQGRENQEATSAVNGDRSTKILRVDISIDRVTVLREAVQLATLTELRFPIAFFFFYPVPSFWFQLVPELPRSQIRFLR